MTRIRFVFALFSLMVLAAPARAQSGERDHGHGRSRGGIATGRRDENDRDSRRARENDDDDEDGGNRIDRSRTNGGDDDEDDDRDDDGDDDNRGISRTSGCIDQNGNNICDVAGNGATLPEMVNAILVSRGQLTRSGRFWLGKNAVTPRYAASSNRVPSQVTWLDGAGRVSQVWLDSNRDGRADVVRLYRSGRLVRTFRRQ